MTIKSRFVTIDEYIALQPAATRDSLKKIRQTIKKAVPEAEEVISYQMPAFRFYGMLAWFALFKDHYGLFIRPRTLDKFRDKLKKYKMSKSAVRIPMDEEIPVKLIAEIVKEAAKTNLIDVSMKKAAKSKK